MPTPRLPQVGSDNNSWGDVLNEFLGVSHNSDGTIKDGYLVCKGFLTQSGSSAPVFTAIKDTLLGTWSRSSTGTYVLTKTGAFVLNKTVPLDDTYTDQSGNLYKINRTDINTITLRTYTAANTTVLSDNLITSRFINIEIYN